MMPLKQVLAFVPHTLPAEQALQVRLPSHTPPPHAAPAGWCASAGQLALAPSQLSGRSHSITAARQTTPPAFTRSMHVPAPLQVSCASHPAAFEEPQLVPGGAKAFAGQVGALPSQTSAGSHVGSEPAA
jgi:hypothetical protein